jgi:tetratricopeptide (TPR) repeat protein
LLDEHLKANKGDPAAYLLRGKVRASFGAFADRLQALADFNQSIELDPKSAEAYRGRAGLYRMKEQDDKALSDYTKVIELDPKSAINYLDRADYILFSRMFTRVTPEWFALAVNDYSQAIELDPRDAGGRAHYGRAVATLMKNSRPVEEERGDGKIYTEYESTAEGMKQALPDLGKAVELGSPRAGVLRAKGFELLGDDAAAITEWKAISATRKLGDDELTRLAWLLATASDAKVRDGKAAVEYAKQAVEMTKNSDHNSLNALAAVQAETGDFKSAVESQQKAIVMIRIVPREYQERLELYKKNKPFHREPAPKK